MMQVVGSSVSLSDDYRRYPADVRVSESESKGPTTAQPRVLVVDDERLLADTTALILRGAGFDTKTAYDGFGALETTVSFHPDYLLADIMMPAMNGVELAIAITKMYPMTKILLFSGQAGVTNILEESKAKGFEFPLLAKPIHPSKLIERLQNLKSS
jgi:CheY-like chemotaxis protein